MGEHFQDSCRGLVVGKAGEGQLPFETQDSSSNIPIMCTLLSSTFCDLQARERVCETSWGTLEGRQEVTKSDTRGKGISSRIRLGEPGGYHTVAGIPQYSSTLLRLSRPPISWPVSCIHNYSTFLPFRHACTWAPCPVSLFPHQCLLRLASYVAIFSRLHPCLLHSVSSLPSLFSLTIVSRMAIFC